MSMCLQLDKCISLKLGIRQPMISYCMFCSLRYWLIWNSCFSWYLLYFWLSRQSIVLLWAHLSVHNLDYPLCKTKQSRRSVDVQFDDGLMYVSRSFSTEKAATTSYMNYCHIATRRLAKMHDQHSLTLHWCSFSRWGRKHAAIVFAPKGGQYLTYACLQQIAS